MRPLTKNERFLLGVLALVLLVIVTTLGYRWMSAAQAKLNREVLSLAASRAEAEVTLHDKPMWDARAQWLSAHALHLEDENLAGAKLQKSLQDSASENHLEVENSKIEPHDQDTPASLPSVAVTVEVKGPMQAVILWINKFQSAKDLWAIERCDLKLNNDSKNMTCTLRLRQFFQSKS